MILGLSVYMLRTQKIDITFLPSIFEILEQAVEQEVFSADPELFKEICTNGIYYTLVYTLVNPPGTTSSGRNFTLMQKIFDEIVNFYTKVMKETYPYKMQLIQDGLAIIINEIDAASMKQNPQNIREPFFIDFNPTMAREYKLPTVRQTLRLPETHTVKLPLPSWHTEIAMLKDLSILAEKAVPKMKERTKPNQCTLKL